MTKILVVEDEPGIALGLEDDLRLEGWDVELIGDGVAAARRAREAAFDLILLDVPYQSGQPEVWLNASQNRHSLQQR